MKNINNCNPLNTITTTQAKLISKLRSHIQCNYGSTAYMQLTGKPNPYFDTVGETIFDLWNGDFSIKSLCNKNTSCMTKPEAMQHIKILFKLGKQLSQVFLKIAFQQLPKKVFPYFHYLKNFIWLQLVHYPLYFLTKL